MAISNPVIDPSEGTIDQMSDPLSAFIARIWQTMVILGGLLVLVFLIWGAIEWISSGGDENKLKDAKGKMTNAFIGLVILVGSFAITLLLEHVVGFNILEIVWPTPSQ